MVKEYQINSDTLLWNDFIKGNEDAFRIIYNNHVHSLFRFGCHFTTNEALVKDCIHDVFIDLAKYRSGLGTTNNIQLYLFKSIKRKIIRAQRKSGLFDPIDMEKLPFYQTLSSEELSVESETDRLVYLKLDKALSDLSPRQKEAIYLKFNSGLSYEELSQVMQLNYQSARNLVFRGIEKLRESFPKNMLLFFFKKK